MITQDHFPDQLNIIFFPIPVTEIKKPERGGQISFVIIYLAINVSL